MVYSRAFLRIAAIAAIYVAFLNQSAQTAESGIAAARKSGSAKISTSAAPAGATKIKRYKKTEMSAFTEYKLPPDCSEVSPGEWTVSKKPKYGKTSTGTTTGHLANGDCADKTFTFGTIYYEWTEHSNPSKTDSFTATWKTPDGEFSDTETFTVQVPIVRPTGETTAFAGWADTRGQWQQTLIPPNDDPDFDFSGETIKEVFVSQTDTCYDGQFPGTGATPSRWTVQNKVEWGPDGVGWGNNSNTLGNCAIEYYRCHRRTPCGFIINQQMQISSPADKGAFVDYGGVNTLTALVEGRTLLNKTGVGDITSQRDGGGVQKQMWVTGPLSCPRTVNLDGC